MFKKDCVTLIGDELLLKLIMYFPAALTHVSGELSEASDAPAVDSNVIH